jgi:hypothetical protein
VHNIYVCKAISVKNCQKLRASSDRVGNRKMMFCNKREHNISPMRGKRRVKETTGFYRHT